MNDWRSVAEGIEEFLFCLEMLKSDREKWEGERIGREHWLE